MSTTKPIRDLASKLSADDRAQLAQDLLESLDSGESEASVVAAWTAVIEDRAEVYEAERLAADDWAVSRERAQRRLHALLPDA
jgi:putative addiction module component (TIGR02574 family)